MNRNCIEPFCYEYDIDQLNTLVVKIKNKLVKFGDDLYKDLAYGYKCSPELRENINKLTTYKDVLETNIKQFSLKVQPCLTNNSLNQLIEKITAIIGKNCKMVCTDLDVDSTYEEDWIVNNKTCVSYQHYNKWVRIKAREYEFKFTIEKLKEDFMLELYVESITNDVVLAISSINIANDLGLKVTRTDIDDIKIDFKLLIEKLPNMNLDLKTYVELIENNVSFDIIYEVYKNDLSLKLTNNKLFLETAVNSYPVLDIKLKAQEVSKNYLSDYS